MRQGQYKPFDLTWLDYSCVVYTEAECEEVVVVVTETPFVVGLVQTHKML